MTLRLIGKNKGDNLVSMRYVFMPISPIGVALNGYLSDTEEGAWENLIAAAPLNIDGESPGKKVFIKRGYKIKKFTERVNNK